MRGCEMSFFNMQFCFISSEMFRTDSILLNHVFIVFHWWYLIVFQSSLLSYLRPVICAVMCRQSLVSDMIYGCDSFKTCLFVLIVFISQMF